MHVKLLRYLFVLLFCLQTGCEFVIGKFIPLAQDDSHLSPAPTDPVSDPVDPVDLEWVKIFAGPKTGGTGSGDGFGSEARFFQPNQVVVVGGRLYIADTMNNCIRALEIATGEVTTFAGLPATGTVDGTGTAARFYRPTGLATDGTNLFVTDSFNHTIRKIVIATREVTTIAGSAATSGNVDGAGVNARFFRPTGIVVVGPVLYVADSTNYTIRRVLIATGETTTLAGTGAAGSADGTGVAASFRLVAGLATDGSDLFVADGGNHTVRRVVIATGETTTFAGTTGVSGATDGYGTDASFTGPRAIVGDSLNLYVTTSGQTIRKIVKATGEVTTVAGTSGVSGAVDGVGLAATLSSPYGLALSNGILYWGELGSHTIRRMTISSGEVKTLAGSPGVVTAGSADGIGVAARFSNPQGLATDGVSMFVADSTNHTIRKITIATGDVTTLAGDVGLTGSTDGTGSDARFNGPTNLALIAGNLYVTDYSNHAIRKVDISTGTVTTLAGAAGVSGSTDGIGNVARFNYPWGAVAVGDDLYVSDSIGARIRKIVVATGEVTTFAGSGGNGSTNGIGVAASFAGPRALTTDGSSLYVVETSNHLLRRISLATAEVTTLAGTPAVSGSSDGIGSSASFYAPVGVVTDGTNVFVSDANNRTVRKVVIATGEVTTFAGVAGRTGGSTRRVGSTFLAPHGLLLLSGRLYVTDQNSIRVIASDL